MEKYVNVKDVIKLILNKTYYNNLNGDLYSYEVIHAIEEMPAADVREVVHGEWIQNDSRTWSCGRCQSWTSNEEHYWGLYCLHCDAYRDCLHCGAYMRGVET